MEVLFFFFIYILTGTIRVVRDFVKRDYNSAHYVRHPQILMTLSIILLWPLFPIQRLIEQRRRMNFKYIFDFYLIPLFWGGCAYTVSMIGFSKILASDSDVLCIKVLKITGIIILFSAVIWWLFTSIERKIKEILNKGNK